MNEKTAPRAKRQRRSPEEARQHILDTAEERLATHGLNGLTVNGVAADAGISHASVIHHFGSTDGMRTELFMRLTQALLSDVRESLAQDIPSEQILANLFATLSSRNHGNLLAWRAIANIELPTTGSAELFSDIVAVVEAQRPGEGRNIVLLAASAALGLSICGDPLKRLIDVSDDELDAFPAWFAGIVDPHD